MKTKVLHSVFYIITAFLLISFSDPYTIKRISDANFRYEFYTSDKKVNPKTNKTYYWFKGGLIHSAQAGVAGNVLNEKFVKMYHSNQLAEQGEFRNGLKIGLWKTWYQNGIVETTQYWNSGLRTGLYYHYDKNGNLLKKGNFRKDKMHGEWTDYTKKETVKYKNGKVVAEKPEISKEERTKQKAEKKAAKESKEAEQKPEKPKKATNKSEKKPTEEKKNQDTEEINKPKKENFFTRLFSKKQPKQNTNGQGA